MVGAAMVPAPAEFSRPLAVARLPREGLERLVEANPAECEALARRLRVPAIARLSCRFALMPGRQGRVVAEGDLEALVTQTCVVSLEPFEAVVRERFELHFVPTGSESEDPDPELPDETGYPGETIDLGEAAAEQLALALDPYPRRPGVAQDAGEAGEAEDAGGGVVRDDADEDRAPHPFAALGRLRRNDGS